MENNEVMNNEVVETATEMAIENHSGRKFGAAILGVLAIGAGVVLGVKKFKKWRKNKKKDGVIDGTAVEKDDNDDIEVEDNDE